MLGANLAAASAKPVSYKGRKIKVTAPDGTVYRYPWLHDRKPSESDIAWARADAERRYNEAQATRPADPYKIDETLPKQAPSAAVGAMVGRAVGAGTHAREARPGQWMDELDLNTELKKAAKGTTEDEKAVHKGLRSLTGQGKFDYKTINAAREALNRIAVEKATENAIVNTLSKIENASPSMTKLLGSKGLTGHVAGAVGGTIAAPADVAMRAASVVAPGATPMQRVEDAAVGVLTAAAPAIVSRLGKGLSKIVQGRRYAKAAKSGPGFDLPKKGLPSEEALNPLAVKESPQPPVPVSEVAEAPKVARTGKEPAKPGISEEAPPQATAAKNDLTTQYRKDLGLDDLPETEKETFGGWLDSAVKSGTVARARQIAQSTIDDPKRVLNAEETVGMAARMGDIRRRVKHLQSQADPAAANELQDLLDEADTITTSLKTSGTEHARAMVARQAGVTPDYDVVTLRTRAKGLNAGADLSRRQHLEIDKYAGRIEKLERDMESIRDEVKASMRASVKRPNSRGSTQARRDSAINTLRRYGLPTADPGVQLGGMPRPKAGRRSGAILNPFAAWASNDVVRRSVRQLVRTYNEEGVADLDGVLGRLKADIPGLDEGQYLALLSDKYKVAKLEADVAKIQAERFLKSIKRASEAQQRSISSRIGSQIGRELGSVQRAFQTAFDIGYTTIQGHKVLAVNPKAVVTAGAESMRLMKTLKTQEGFDKLWAAIEADPAYARAKKAGVQFDDMDTGNEFFGTGYVTKFPGVFKSEAMFKAYKNRLRLDLFKGFGAASPDDAAHLASTGNLVNILTGTATGKPGQVARAVGSGFYAPSYEVSKWQFALMQPLVHAAKTNGVHSAAFRQAAGVYAKNAAVWIAGVWAAKEAGADIDTDIRSADFGKLTLPGGMQIDLFGKSFSPLHNMAQLFWGNISRKGEFKASDQYGATTETFGRFVEGKMAPLPKTLMNLLSKGTQFNFDTGEEEEMSGGNLLKNLAPIGGKGAITGALDPELSEAMKPLLLLELLGVGTGKQKPQTGKKPPPPLGLPTGLSKVLGR